MLTSVQRNGGGDEDIFFFLVFSFLDEETMGITPYNMSGRKTKQNSLEREMVMAVF